MGSLELNDLPPGSPYQRTEILSFCLLAVFSSQQSSCHGFRWQCSIIYVQKGQSLHAFEDLHQLIGGKVGGRRCEQA